MRDIHTMAVREPPLRVNRASRPHKPQLKHHRAQFVAQRVVGGFKRGKIRGFAHTIFVALFQGFAHLTNRQTEHIVGAAREPPLSTHAR
jgi:hypothetical protein